MENRVQQTYSCSVSRGGGPIVLAVAPAGDSDFLDTTSQLGRMPNIGVLYLAGALNAAGYETITLDRHNDQVSPLSLAREIADLSPSLVGFTLYDMTMEATKQTLLFLTLQYNGPIVVGGYTATSHVDEVLDHWPEVDYVIVREGEHAIVALKLHLDGHLPIADVPNCVYRDQGSNKRTPEQSLVDVTSTPWPKRKWPEQADLTAILSRRGCTNACTFCSMVPFYDRDLGPVVRYRTPEDVVDEIAYCVDNGAMEFMFYDDAFGLSSARERQWCSDFCNHLLDRNLRISFGMEVRITDVIRGGDSLHRLRDAGLTHLQIGMESLIPRQLKLYRKGYKPEKIVAALSKLRELPIDYQTNVLFWDPSIVLTEALEHIEKLEEIGITNQLGSANFAVFAGTLAIRKDTGLYNRWCKLGRLRQRDREFYRYDCDFEDEQVAVFHRTHLHRFLCETRKGVERPPPLWMVVPRLERLGHVVLADALRSFGQRLAASELAYFRELLKTAVNAPMTSWPDLLGTIHDKHAPSIRAQLTKIPHTSPEILSSVSFHGAMPSDSPAESRL